MPMLSKCYKKYPMDLALSKFTSTLHLTLLYQYDKSFRSFFFMFDLRPNATLAVIKPHNFGSPHFFRLVVMGNRGEIYIHYAIDVYSMTKYMT